MWIDTKHSFHGCWKIIINYFAEEKKTFSVSEGVKLNTLKLFLQNVLLFFFATSMKNFFFNQFNIFMRTMHWSCYKNVIFTVKHQKISLQFLFSWIFFCVFSRSSSRTLKVFFGKIFYYFFFYKKCVLY